MLLNKRKKLNIFILLAAVAAVLSLPVAATATKSIPSDLSIGTWDSANRIYTLNTNVSETIQIDEDNLTLDGAGYTVTGAGSGNGVYLYQRSNVTITNLTVEGFYNGIHLYYNCQYNTLTCNTASNNNTGIFLYDNSNNNTLTGNTTASNDSYGIYLLSSSTNTLTGNSVSNNSSTGIYLLTSSGNTLTGNTVASNPVGIYLHSSSTNLIYNNNFIDNNLQAYVFYGGGNDFNQPPPTGGNYWSDWTSPDVAPEDGFVDLPYVFNGGQDDLPWTEMDGWPQPEPEIVVYPAILSHDFGDVPIGESRTYVAQIMNIGNADLEVSSITLDSLGSADFTITSAPETPVTVAPSDIFLVDIEITFTPTTEGYVSTTLLIESNDADEPLVGVELGGVGVIVEIPPEQQIQNILDFFNQSVSDGTLVGYGPGNSPEKRLNALRNMIKAAGDLINAECYAQAIEQLESINKKTDGERRPPDFVVGEAIPTLNQMVKALIEDLSS